MAQRTPLNKKDAKWQAMSRKERRIAIAKDVIAQLHAQRLRPNTGGYARGKLPTDWCEKGKDESAVTSQDLRSLTEHCQTCALGSLWVSKVRLFNGLTRGELREYMSFTSFWPAKADNSKFLTWGYTELVGWLAGAFTKNQIELIENAFEGWNIDEDACRFHDAHPDPADRLLAIMQNIIDHDGTFKPEVQYVVS